MARRSKTLNEMIEEVKELEGKAATFSACASHLRTRYLGRDSTSALARIRNSDGSPVEEAVIELVAAQFEEEAEEMMETAAAYRGEVVSG